MKGAKRQAILEQKMTALHGILALLVLLVIAQLWLLNVTVAAYQGHEDAALWPAAIASGVCFAFTLLLLRGLKKVENAG